MATRSGNEKRQPEVAKCSEPTILRKAAGSPDFAALFQLPGRVSMRIIQLKSEAAEIAEEGRIMTALMKDIENDLSPKKWTGG